MFISVLLFDITRTIDLATSICIIVVAMSNLVASLFTKVSEPAKEPEKLDFPEDSEYAPMLPPPRFSEMSSQSSFISQD